MAWACRREAPPGFRAASRASCRITAIRLQSLTPSRLRLPPEDRRKAHPCRAVLDARRIPPNRQRRIGQAGAPAAMGGELANTLELAAAGCKIGRASCR